MERWLAEAAVVDHRQRADAYLRDHVARRLRPRLHTGGPQLLWPLRVKQTTTDQADPERILLNGTIKHGTQIFAPELNHTPTTYYGVNSGIGLAMRFCCDGHRAILASSASALARIAA